MTVLQRQQNEMAQSATLPGFENVNRYWDRLHEAVAAKILPGEYYVTRNEELITTVLGSCVAACIRDRVQGIGGMNHFMLPVSADGSGWNGSSDILSQATRYGNYAMEHMINDILKHGGRKTNLEAKVFGGGKIIKTMTDIGFRNIGFVRDYLKSEAIPMLAEDVAGFQPRKVIYFPSSGRALVKRLKRLHNDTVIQRETRYQEDLSDRPLQGEVELF